MKKIFISLLSSAALLFTVGCDNLALKPESVVTDPSAWRSSGFYSAFMSGLHSRMRDHANNLTFMMGEARSDAYGGRAFGGEAPQGVEVWWLNNFTATATGTSNFGDFYNNINQLNLMIVKTSGVDEKILDKTTRNYYLGQSYGMRAFYYFAIYKTYLEAVIHTDPTMGIDIQTIAKAASKREDIMKLIKADIKASEEAFAEDYSFKATKGYWSKAATLMLKAEVNLWTSRHENGGTADAQTALDALNLIQTKIPALKLEATYADAFAYGNKLKNAEVIFAMRYALNEASMPIGNFLPQWSYLQNFYVADGTKISTDQAKYNLFGLMRLCFSNKSYDQYDDADTRKTTNLLEVFSKTNDVLSRAGFVLWKYQGVQEPGQTGRSLVNDLPIYRYADLLLLKAEAKMILGQDFSADINAVRKRAYGAAWNEATYGYPNQTGDENAADAILTERFKEFLGEGKRWYDLRRFGNAYVYKNVPAVDASDVNKLYLPIDVNTLTNNNKLVQNPAYL